MQPCPQCGSDQIKKASLVYEEGVRVGGGVGIGTGGVGIAAGGSVSAAAARCAPPILDKKAYHNKYKWKVIFSFIIPIAIVGNIAGITSPFVILWGIAMLVYIGVTSSKFDVKQKAEHEQAVADYDRTYVCQRCGQAYQPFE